MKIRSVDAWVLYDWANSAFAITVVTAFFPILFENYWLDFWNYSSPADTAMARVALVNSWVGVIVAVGAPLLASLAASTERRKSYLVFWTSIGVVAVVALSLVKMGNWVTALLLFGLARIGFQFSNLFYDTLLASVAPLTLRHRISTRGYAYGYLGGGLFFLGAILLVTMAGKVSFLGSSTAAALFSIFVVAHWWFLFGLPLMRTKFRFPDKVILTDGSRFTQFRRNIVSAFSIIKNDNNILFFLIAYWFYIDGVHTVIVMSTSFGLSVGISSSGLMIALLAVQLVAFPASLYWGSKAQKLGGKRVISILVIGYAFVVFIGAIIVRDAITFGVLAIIVGMMQGGVQALSRSFFSRIVPQQHLTALFGIYSMVGRFSVILGPVLIYVITRQCQEIGVGEGISGRISFAALSLFFLLGLFFLHKVKTVEEA